MTISESIAPTVLEKPLPPQRPPSDTSGDAETTRGAAASTTSAAAATDVSAHAQALSTLQTLSATDPDKFKQAASDYADTLQTLAAQAGGAQGAHLTRLAQKFDDAAKSGKISVLQPPAAPAGSVQAAYAQHSPHGLRLPHALPRVLPPGTHSKGLRSVPLVAFNALRAIPPQA